jgi:hypothetical protein
MRWKLIIAALLVIAGVLAFFLLRENSSTRTLDDGSKLVLSGVRIGRTNVYTHGSFLSQTIGRFIPSNGLSIAGYDLQPPSRVALYDWWGQTQAVEVLTAQLRLLPASARADDFLKPPFYRKFRLLIVGDDGFTYVQEFDAFKRYEDGLFRYVNAHTFPRTSRTVQFRIEERDNPAKRNFRDVAAFAVKNPKRAKVEPWSIDESPRITLAADLTIELGDLVVRSEPNPRDIWDHVADLSFRVTNRGRVLTNWAIHHTRIRDASGNTDWFFGSTRITNDWTIYRSHRVLDPFQPWRFDVNFALDSDFPETNLFSFAITWPMAATNQTEFGGLPVSISFVNTDMLAVELPSKPPHLRLTFVSAFDDVGQNVNEGSGSWGQHSFWKLLKVRHNKGMNVTATIAIHPNYPATFTLQPRFDKTPTLP